MPFNSSKYADCQEVKVSAGSEIFKFGDLRSYLDSRLVSLGYSPKEFTVSYWKIRENLSWVLSDVCGIYNSDFDHKLDNFLACQRPKKPGSFWEYEDKQAIRWFHCGNRYCPTCRDRKRAVSAKKLFRIIKKSGVEKVWRLVFTFPDEVARSAFSDDELQKTLLQIVRATLKTAFGVKQRDNLGVVPAVHLVGDTDITKDRFHIHTLVVPATYDKKNESLVYIEKEEIDLPALNADLNKRLRKAGVEQTAINPEVSFIPVEEERKLKHALRYDLRGFGLDLYKSVLKYSSKFGVYCVKQNKKEYGKITEFGVKIMSDIQFSQRWKDIVDNSPRMSFWGWLNYAEKLFPEEKTSVDDIFDQGEKIADVYIQEERVSGYDKDRKRIVKKDKLFAYVPKPEYQGRSLESLEFPVQFDKYEIGPDGVPKRKIKTKRS